MTCREMEGTGVSPRQPFASCSTPEVLENNSFTISHVDQDKHLKTEEPKPKWIMYSSAGLATLFGSHYGWCISQLNLSTFHDSDDCKARPVPEGKCLMFPGHSDLEWTFVINLWLFGGMVGALSVGHFASKYGPKRVLRFNAFVIIASAVLQASSFHVWQFAIGRFIAGLATGITSGVVPGYLSEISPPSMRSSLGVSFQAATVLSILLVILTFYFANTSSGWRYIGGFPSVLALTFLLFSPRTMVESPVWLVVKGRRSEAEGVLVRMYGKENVHLAMQGIESTRTDDGNLNSIYSDLSEDLVKPLRRGETPSLLSPELRLQMIAGLALVVGRQMTGINTIFYYSSGMFRDAGVQDDRVGNTIIDIVNVLPMLVAIKCVSRFGARKMLISGTCTMLVSAIGMTVALLTEVSALSIVFSGIYVFAFQMSQGPFVWTVCAAVFPDSVRATAMSLCVGFHFFSNLAVGVFYPYLSAEIDAYRYIPFCGCMIALVFYLVIYLPETTGRTTDEIQQDFLARRKK